MAAALEPTAHKLAADLKMAVALETVAALVQKMVAWETAAGGMGDGHCKGDSTMGNSNA